MGNSTRLVVTMEEFQSYSLECAALVEELKTKHGVYDQDDFNQYLSYLSGVADTLPNPACMKNIIHKLTLFSNHVWNLNNLVREEEI